MAEILIIGAGIGGLCAARAAALAGHRPALLERSEHTAVGAALALWPNAVRALDELGCGEAIRKVGTSIERVQIRSKANTLLATTDMGALARSAGAPMLMIERPELHRLLGDGLEPPRIATVAAVDGGGVTLASGELIEAAVTIGADGVGSTARRHVAPDSRIVETGHTAVRGIADHGLGEPIACEVWGSGELVGAAALAADRTYWFYEAPTDRFEPAAGDPLAAVDATSWPDPWPAIVAATPRERLLVHAIRTLTPLASWHRGRVALLGDAAHAMEPNLGQGAAQSIEDAAALATALSQQPDLPQALRRYAESRRARAAMIQRESARAARLALSRHQRARNLFVRATPDAVRSLMLRRLLAPSPPPARR